MFKIFIILSLLLSLGCQSAVDKAARNTVYSAYEVVGVHKRDLLKRRVNDAKEEQKETDEAFVDALEQLKKVYSFSGGNLESQYNKVKASYDRASKQSEDVHKSVDRMEKVADDLFGEWKKEIQDIQSPNLRSRSRETLVKTEKRYADLHLNLKKAEDSMAPVLTQFHDQVLFLKHNLNAEAVGSLKGESQSIQKEIEKLIAQVRISIAESDKFIQQMPE